MRKPKQKPRYIHARTPNLITAMQPQLEHKHKLTSGSQFSSTHFTLESVMLSKPFTLMVLSKEANNKSANVWKTNSLKSSGTDTWFLSKEGDLWTFFCRLLHEEIRSDGGDALREWTNVPVDNSEDVHLPFQGYQLLLPSWAFVSKFVDFRDCFEWSMKLKEEEVTYISGR